MVRKTRNAIELKTIFQPLLLLQHGEVTGVFQYMNFLLQRHRDFNHEWTPMGTNSGRDLKFDFKFQRECEDPIALRGMIF